MEDIGILNVKPAEDTASRRRLPAGGYVMKVITAIDYPEYKYLELMFDISCGEWAGYGARVEEYTNSDFAYPKLRAYYTDKAKPQFRKMLDLFERENKVFAVSNFNNDEKKLVGLTIGVVLDEDDYNDYFKLKPNYYKLTTSEKIAKREYRVKYLSESRKIELERLAEQRKAEREANDSPATSSGTVIPF